MNNDKYILKVSHLTKYYQNGERLVKAVDSNSFNLEEGEILGLVGQSGSGKTTTGQAIIRMIKDISGFVSLDGKLISGKKISRANKKYLRENIQMIFQNPHSSLSPKKNVFSIIQEPYQQSQELNKDLIKLQNNWSDVVETFEFTFIDEMLKFYEKYLDQVIAVYKKSLLKKVSGNSYIEYLQVYDNLNNDIKKSVIILNDFNLNILEVYKQKQEELEKLENLTPDEVIYRKSLQKYNDKKEFLEWEITREKLINEKNDELRTFVHDFKTNLISFATTYKKLAKEQIKYGRMAKYPMEYKQLMVSAKINLELIKVIKIIKELNMVCEIDTLTNILSSITEEATQKITTFSKKIIKKKSHIFKKELFNFVIDIKIPKKHFITNEEFIKKRQDFYVSKILPTLKPKDVNGNLEELKNKLDNDHNDFKLEKIKYDKEYHKSLNAKLVKIGKKVIENKNLSKEIEKYIRFLEKQIKKFIVDKNDSSFKKDLSSVSIKMIIEKRRFVFNKIKTSHQNVKSEIKLLKKKIIQSNKILNITSFRFDNEKVILGRKTNLQEDMKITFWKKRTFKKILVLSKVYEMLRVVGLKSEHAYRYPHEFSGGQAQRIAIIKAIVMKPRIIIADEPIASLDVSIQAQVINILLEYQRLNNISIIFIAHDLEMIKFIADRTLIMNFGKVIEQGDSTKVFDNPQHIYTKELLSAIPKFSNAHEKFEKIEHDFRYMYSYINEKPFWVKVEEGHEVLVNRELMKEWNIKKGG